MELISSRHTDLESATGCSWEEKPIGESRVVRCGDTVMPGKPWCVTHWTRCDFSQNGPLQQVGSRSVLISIGVYLAGGGELPRQRALAD
jgi:hypothetical protein